MDKRLGRPTGAAGSLFLIVHNVKQQDPEDPSTRAAARGYAKLAKQKGGLRTHASAGRVTRAERSLRGIPRALPSCLSAEGFSPAAGLIRLS